MTMPRQKPGRSRQDYGTPWEFLNRVKDLLQISHFSLDLAATRANSKGSGTRGTWDNRYYDIEYDSLKRVGDWMTGEGPYDWAWLNPPFGNIAPWVKKAWHESGMGAQIAVLVPASVGSNWWRDWVHMKAEVIFLNGRITFEGETAPFPKDCALLLYGRHRDSGDWNRADDGRRMCYSVWNWKTESQPR